MEIGRIKELKEICEAEALDLTEISEIEEAFALIPDNELRDERENALAYDMLEELEARITPIEQAIYDYVVANFGENEANDPSWAIGPLAGYLNNLKETF